MEGAYENCPRIRCGKDVNILDQRRQAWQAFFAGAAGFGYGVFCHWVAKGNNNDCGSDFSQGLPEKLSKADYSIKPLAKFLKSKSFHTFIPDQDIIASRTGTGVLTRVAVRRGDKKEFYVYFPRTGRGSGANIRMNRIAASRVVVEWWKPNHPELAIKLPTRGSYSRNDTPFLEPPASWDDALLVVRGGA